MNIILCVVAALILVNVAKSVKSVEEEMAEEVKRVLEQFKIKSESMKQKLESHPQLQNNFKTAVTDATKIIETLKETLKVFEQQRIEKERAKATLSKPKRELTNILEKLPELISTLGELKSEAKSSNDVLGKMTNTSIQYAGEFTEALEAALNVEDKDMDIAYLEKKALALSARTSNIGAYAKNAEYARNPGKATEWQQSAYGTIQDFRKTIMTTGASNLGMSCLSSALRRYIKNSSILSPNNVPLCLQRCHNFNISCQTHTCVTNGVADNLLCSLSKSHFGNPKAITVASSSITAQHDSTQLNKHRDQYQPKPSDHRRLLLPGLSEAISISSFSTTARYYSLTKLHKYRGQYWFKRKNDRHRIALYGLAVFTTVESINAHFAKFGTVSDSGIGKRILSGFTGFVEFESIDDANAAAKFFPHFIDDREVSVVRYSDDKLNKCRIVVWDLPYKCPSIKTIQEFYSQFGAICKCHMGSNGTNNYAVISFKTNKQANRALEARPHIIDGIVLQAKCGDKLNPRIYPIFVGSLPRNVTEKLLIEAFSMFGKLVHWELFNDDRFLIKLRRDRPFAFISYSAEKEAIRAQKYGARVIDGQVLDLKFGKAMICLLRDINEYKRQRSSKGSSSLFIPFLPENVTPKSLTEVFSKFGVLKSLDLVNDERLIRDGKKTPPYAIVSYATQEDALKAFDSGPHTVEGKLVRANYILEEIRS